MRSSFQTPISYYNTSQFNKNGGGEGDILLGHFSWKETDQKVQNLFFSWLKVQQPLTMFLACLLSEQKQTMKHCSLQKLYLLMSRALVEKAHLWRRSRGYSTGLIHTACTFLTQNNKDLQMQMILKPSHLELQVIHSDVLMLALKNDLHTEKLHVSHN